MEQPVEVLPSFGVWAKRTRQAVERAEKAELGKAKLHVERSSYGVLRVACYAYWRALEVHDATSQLQTYLWRRDGARWQTHKGEPVDWVLRLLEVDDVPFLTPPRRARIANQLRVAAKCKVRTKWLLPFLYEAGNDESVAALLAARKEPDWVEKYRWDD